MSNRGFTLIELLVVISIISLLSSILMTSINQSRIKARNIQRIANADAIAKGFYIATTGTTNELLDTMELMCLGKSPCWIDTYYAVRDSNLDSLLRTGMAGGIIPLDPTWKTPDAGDAFLYYKWAGEPTAGIVWVMEYDPGNSLNYCGKGVSLGNWNTTVTGSWACILPLEGEPRR